MAAPQTDASRRQWRDVGDPNATAVIPITLLLIGNIETGPWTIELRVPTFDPIPGGVAGTVVAGAFEIDLLSLPQMPRVPQTYFLRAISGEVITEPAMTALVPEEALNSYQ